MTAPPRFELFSYWRTSATYRVRVACHLKGVTPEERNVNLDTGEQRGPEFLRINPMGAIPALIDREEPHTPPLTESLAILEFLDELYPAPPLLPADLHGRARVRSLAQMLAADTHPLVVPRVKRYLVGAGFDDAAWRAWQMQWFGTGLRAVEQRLRAEAGSAGTGTFCHGETAGMADICLMSIIVVMRVFGITVPGTPTIERIVEACERLDAFARADPYRQPGAPIR